MRKPFDQRLFDANDVAARTAVTQYIHATQDAQVTENPDRYGVDLLVAGGLGNEYCVEVEVKRVWRGSEFPWATVQLPERKLKLARLAESRNIPLEFWILNAQLTHALVFTHESVLSSPLVEVPNKYVRLGEKFVQVPIEKCRMVVLT